MNRRLSPKLAVGIREAASMLGVSHRTVERFIAARLLPSRKIGRRTVVLVAEVELFLRKDQPSPDAKGSGVGAEAIGARA